MTSKAVIVKNSEQRTSAICDLNWVRMQTAPSSKFVTKKSISVIDLFSGCGGLSLGAFEGARLNNRKLDVRFALDISPIALSVYRKNLFSVANNVVAMDINNLFPGIVGTRLRSIETEFARHVGAVDVLLAGPPCQGHSDLNNKSRRNDPRNALYNRVVRAVEVVLPSAVLVENVPTVVHSKEGVVGSAMERLLKLGYKVSEMSVSFSKLGLAQTRKRHCLLAVRDQDLTLEEIFGSYTEAPVTLREYMWDIRNEFKKSQSVFETASRLSKDNIMRASYLLRHDLYNLPNALRPACHKLKQHSYVSMYGRLSWDKPAQTITSGFGSMGQGRYLHPSYIRTLTPHEAARLQGFPDFFSFLSVTSRTALQEMIGNAVPPKLSAVIVDYLLKRRAL